VRLRPGCQRSAPKLAALETHRQHAAGHRHGGVLLELLGLIE
jgi:hypothetical protein